MPKRIFFLFVTLFFSFSAWSDDSSIGYANGALIFTKDNFISLDDESLLISSSKINIFYTFYNHSNHAITKTIAFPFPGRPYDGKVPTAQKPCFDKYIEKRPSKECPFLDFKGKINGKEVTNYTIKYVAINSKGHDITALLIKNEIPLSSYFVTGVLDYDGSGGAGEIDRNPALKAKLKKLKIIPNWTTQILLSWQETFPAKSKLTVEESYTPSVSHALMATSVSCLLSNEFSPSLSPSGNSLLETEAVQYILKTGANWKGGLIGKFHLEIIPTPFQAVALCYPSPMRAEQGKFIGDFKNFLPAKDLNVSFIKKINN